MNTYICTNILETKVACDDKSIHIYSSCLMTLYSEDKSKAHTRLDTNTFCFSLVAGKST